MGNCSAAPRINPMSQEGTDNYEQKPFANEKGPQEQNACSPKGTGLAEGGAEELENQPFEIPKQLHIHNSLYCLAVTNHTLRNIHLEREHLENGIIGMGNRHRTFVSWSAGRRHIAVVSVQDPPPIPDIFTLPVTLRGQFSDEQFEMLIQEFKRCDQSRDGKIHKNQISSILQTLSLPMTEDKLEYLVNELDTSQDGMLDFRKFIQLVLDVRSGKAAKGIVAMTAQFKGGSSKIIRRLSIGDEKISRSLPIGWEPYRLKSSDTKLNGRIYYYHKESGAVSWQRPEVNVFYLPYDLEATFSEDELHALKQQFMAFDLDGNGTISPLEVQSIMDYFGYNISKTKLQKMMEKIDLDKSGDIDFTEFVLMIRHVKSNQMQAVTENDKEDSIRNSEMESTQTNAKDPESLEIEKLINQVATLNASKRQAESRDFVPTQLIILPDYTTRRIVPLPFDGLNCECRIGTTGVLLKRGRRGILDLWEFKNLGTQDFFIEQSSFTFSPSSAEIELDQAFWGEGNASLLSIHDFCLCNDYIIMITQPPRARLVIWRREDGVCMLVRELGEAISNSAIRNLLEWLDMYNRFPFLEDQEKASEVAFSCDISIRRLRRFLWRNRATNPNGVSHTENDIDDMHSEMFQSGQSTPNAQFQSNIDTVELLSPDSISTESNGQGTGLACAAKPQEKLTSINSNRTPELDINLQGVHKSQEKSSDCENTSARARVSSTIHVTAKTSPNKASPKVRRVSQSLNHMNSSEIPSKATTSTKCHKFSFLFNQDHTVIIVERDTLMLRRVNLSLFGTSTSPLGSPSSIRELNSFIESRKIQPRSALPDSEMMKAAGPIHSDIMMMVEHAVFNGNQLGVIVSCQDGQSFEEWSWCKWKGSNETFTTLRRAEAQVYDLSEHVKMVSAFSVVTSYSINEALQEHKHQRIHGQNNAVDTNHKSIENKTSNQEYMARVFRSGSMQSIVPLIPENFNVELLRLGHLRISLVKDEFVVILHRHSDEENSQLIFWKIGEESEPLGVLDNIGVVRDIAGSQNGKLVMLDESGAIHILHPQMQDDKLVINRLIVVKHVSK